MKINEFSAHVGNCSMTLGMDRRKKYADGYNLAIKYVIGGATLYHRLSWRVSESLPPIFLERRYPCLFHRQSVV